ncbi:hypothetical protein HYV64_00010 [Candidatus Shapirobacteria bacterium]|nr:hypothetical protein [Candidatus Shapirobacteria bacterium]
MSDKTTHQECCPKFDPKPWDNTAHTWKDKKFIRSKVFTFFYMPLNFGSVITRLMNKASATGIDVGRSICLSDHTSPWNMDIYVEVNKAIPGVDNVTLSGSFLSKVYEGDFKDTGKWCQDFSGYLKEKGKALQKMFMWYTTCPACAKKYGKNYTVIFGKI